MKVISLSDLHMGRRHMQTYPHVNRIEVTAKVLYECAKIGVKHDARTIIIGGDLLDKAYPDIDTLLALFFALLYLKSEGFTVIWIRGNHEVYLNSRLETNVMHLYSQVCRIVCEPQTLRTERGMIVMIPWHPNVAYMKKCYAEAAHLASQQTIPCVLITHVGLAEGRPSPSNFMLPQPISVEDLIPSQWDAVFLGDYHEHQMVAENVCYMGAPIPHNHGDTGQVGVWLLEVSESDYRPIPLEGVYPKFMRFSHHQSDVPSFPLDPRDYNEIRVKPGLMDTVKGMYPTARVLPLEETGRDFIEIQGQRMRKEDIRTPAAMVDAYLRYVGVANERLQHVGIALMGGLAL